MDTNRQYAVRIMVHYMQTVFQAAGLHWDSDNVAEITGAIDSIVAAAVNDAIAEFNDREGGEMDDYTARKESM